MEFGWPDSGYMIYDVISPSLTVAMPRNVMLIGFISVIGGRKEEMGFPCPVLSSKNTSSSISIFLPVFPKIGYLEDWAETNKPNMTLDSKHYLAVSLIVTSVL